MSDLKKKRSNGSGKYLPKNIKEILEIHPKSHLFKEPYRTLRTNLHLLNSNSSLKTLMVTSSEPSEGKTTIVVNLAVSFLEEGANVLIVDCDLRKPQVHNYFEMENYPGLTEVLLGLKKTEEVIKNFHSNLSVIPSGSQPKDPLQLLGAPATGDFIESLKRKFDIILFDLPPILSFNDPILISRHVDGALFVLNSGVVKEEILKRAKGRLEKFNIKVLGVVMNRFESGKHGYGYNPYYGYYYDSKK